MKTFVTRWLGLSFLLIALGTQTTEATVIDFIDIPDGTPVTAGNPYAGLLVLDGYMAWRPPGGGFLPEDYPFPPDQWVLLPTEIFGGRINNVLAFDKWPPVPSGWEHWDPSYCDFDSHVNGTFLQPVTDVSIDVFGILDFIGYSYAGENGKGETASGGGLLYEPNYGNLAKLDLDLPDGFYLKQFDIAGWDAPYFEFQVGKISFTILSVPENAPSAIPLALGCLAVFASRPLLCRARPFGI